MQESAKEIEKLIWEWYVPSSIERKKSVLMYFFVGILVWISNKKLTVYEIYHLKQSIGWWMIFFILLIFSSFTFRIPFIRILPFFVFLGLIVVRGFFVKQAWDWYYVFGDEKILFPFFSGLWWWVVDVFELEIDKETIEKSQKKTSNSQEHTNFEK